MIVLHTATISHIALHFRYENREKYCHVPKSALRANFMMEPERQAVLILGMHRSGTSAVAGAVSSLGATLPAHMLPAAPDNPSGFWESAAVAAVNDRILSDAGSTWYDCLGFDCDELDLKARTTAITFIMFSMLADYADGRLPLIKDPRICLLLDLWLPVLLEMKISPAVLLVLRHPSEVAGSLAKRDLLPTALTTALWLRHVLAAEHASRGRPRHILAYEALLRDWRGTLLRAGQKAAIDWPISFDTAAGPMEAFLDTALRHHRVHTRACRSISAPLGIWADEAYAALLALGSADADAQQCQRLDRIRAEFWDWCRQHGRTWSTAFLAEHPLRRQVPLDIPAAWEAAISRLQQGQA